MVLRTNDDIRSHLKPPLLSLDRSNSKTNPRQAGQAKRQLLVQLGGASLLLLSALALGSITSPLPVGSSLQLASYPSMHRQQRQYTAVYRQTAANRTSQHQHQHQQRRPDSSSSFFADIEDLTDSSIRIRTGLSPSTQHRADPAVANDGTFDRIIEHILRPVEGRDVFSQSQKSLVDGLNGHGSFVAADANNKTTMRFFQNNKTFASIVYTNEQPIKKQQLCDSAAGSCGKARRLINCHLVDLERHASDIALFEAKYNIKTIGIEFREMMQLIEACTEIARFKPSRLQAGRSQLANHSHQPQAAGGAGKNNASPFANATAGSLRPYLVVGRPVPVLAPMPAGAGGGKPAFERVMSQALNKELNNLGYPIVDDSNKLNLPPITSLPSTTTASATSIATARTLSSQFWPRVGAGLLRRRQVEPQTSQSQQIKHSHHHKQPLLSNLVNVAAATAAAQAGKKLVLGEVTPPPPSIVEGGKSVGIKEALQEITSYDSTDLMAIWKGILPGTNWCGMGDRAASYNDLGFESDIDICCRAHDFCPIRLSAFTSGYGLFNWSFYTRSHCSCDQNFLNCLQRAESPLSAVVMRFYFTIMKTTCLHDNETPIGARSQPQQQDERRDESTLLMNTANYNGGRLTDAQQLQQRLMDQLRATLPIPAVLKSRLLRAKLENEPTKVGISNNKANFYPIKQQQVRSNQ